MPQKGKRKRSTGEEVPDGIFDDEDGEPAPVKRPRKKKPYVPALRSGAYALVLALSSVPEDSLQSLSKAELQVLAQPFCDSSFTVPSEANKFYTAWNSMKTLVDKDLVQEKGRPNRKYYLSDEGWEVARRIKAVEGRGTGNGTMNCIRQDTIGKPTTATLSAEQRAFSPFWLDAHDLDKDVDERGATMPILNQRPCQRSAETEGACSAIPSQTEQSHAVKPYNQHSLASSVETRGTQLDARTSFVDLLSSPEQDSPKVRPRVQHGREFSKSNTQKEASSKSAPTKPRITQPTHASKPTENSTSPLPEIPDLSSIDSITLAPGTFTVQLVLDTREVRTKSDRDYIHDELVKKGIKPLVRALELGDFFWVAKMIDSTTLSRHGEAEEHSDELALDWIVERKRLDDLVGSITDGRFSEQKFRLKKSGVRNVIYLIEEFTLSNEKETHFHEAVQSAIASTQVVNGYFVKRTLKLDDTISYIARMTRLLKTLYESKPLHLIPTNIIQEDNYLPLIQRLRSDPIHASRSYHLTYPTFAAIVSKTDNLTLRDVFIKMLMCTRGVSVDKALALQKIWETPRALMEAFEACITAKDREFLVANKMEGFVGRGRIKRALSQKIAGIWGEL